MQYFHDILVKENHFSVLCCRYKLVSLLCQSKVAKVEIANSNVRHCTIRF